MKPLFLIIISFLIVYNCIETSAQGLGTLRGFVSDSSNGEVLVGANIYIPSIQKGNPTNEKGFYFIPSIPTDSSLKVIASYVGYKNQVLFVTIKNNSITEINIKLVPEIYEIGEIEKIANKHENEENNIGLIRITPKDLERLPVSVESDIFRSLQNLAGVSFVGDVSSRYNVRGGRNNQNLVLLNGVTIYNPFHALGLFSSIDPDIVNNIEFYKAAFPVDYDGRVSSVMKITTKDGNRNKYSGSFTSSFLTFKGFLEGPIPHGSFYISARKSHSTNILKKFLDNKNAPFDFYDLSFKINYQNPNSNFIDGSKFTIHGFYSGDKIENDDPLIEDFKWNNKLFGFKRFQIYDSPLYSELSMAYSEFKGELIPKKSNSRAILNEVYDVSVKMDFNYIYNNSDELGVGTEFKGLRTKLFLLHNSGVASNINDFGGIIGFYGKYKLTRFKKLKIDVGLRINLEGLKNRGNFLYTTRINALYKLSESLRLKSSWGIFQQGITTLIDESSIVPIFEPWILTPEYLNPTQAIHYNIAGEYNYKNLTLVIEGYLKFLNSLPIVNDAKNYPEDNDLIEGSGKAYGWEFLVDYTTSLVRINSSYSLSWSYENVNGVRYLPKNDSRHSFKTSMDFNLGYGVQAAISWVYKTGMPFTPTVGFYDKLLTDKFSDFNIFESFFPYTLLGDKNVNRLPDYHRMDVSISKKLKIFNSINVEISGSIINVYNRKNIFYFKRDSGEKVNMLPILPTARIKIII